VRYTPHMTSALPGYRDTVNDPPSNGSQPLLTFAIPTWNRADKLKACVSLIAAQVLAAGVPVDIFISDNGSDDATPAVLQELAATYRFVRSIRSPTNVGFDLNLITAIDNSEGKYVWLFSDDDFLAAGALEAVLKIIQETGPSYIATNYYVCDTTGKRLSDHPHDAFMVQADMPGVDLDTLFLTSRWMLGTMTRNIFLKRLVDVEQCRAERSNVEMWPQLYVIGQVVGDRGDAYICSYYAVGCRAVTSRFPGDALINKLPDALDYTLRTFHVSDATRKRCINQIRETYITWLSYIKYRTVGPEISPLIYPTMYRFIPLPPRFLILAALHVKALLR
jgi:glycosyltransferase involved in cell wall biosynthesis